MWGGGGGGGFRLFASPLWGQGGQNSIFIMCVRMGGRGNLII